MEKQKVIILGSLGMLGQELVELFSSDERSLVLAWDKEEVDITQFDILRTKLEQEKPNVVINATGYNAVDLCETSDEEYRNALMLNRDVPAFLAEESKRLGFVLVHYSTDYVFDGMLEENLVQTGCCGGGCCGSVEGSSGGKIGYNEESLPNPLSRYGESKYLGEERVREKAEKYYIIRLSKLFGKPGRSPQAKKSFFEIMLEAGKSKESVEVVDDEKSCFTYAPDLAKATKELIEDGAPSGVYHLANTNPATWYEAVLELYKRADIHIPVIPVDGSAFKRAAERPKNSSLINSKRPPLRPYEEALDEFLKR